MIQLFKTYEIAKQFKEEASELMLRVCDLAQIKISDPDRNFKLRKHFGKQVEHPLDGWTFCFHGAECRFTHSQTNRELEVIVIYADNFGALDFYFFSNFVKQELFKEGNPFTVDQKQIEAQLKELYDQGLLVKLNTGLTELNRNLTA